MELHQDPTKGYLSQHNHPLKAGAASQEQPDSHLLFLTHALSSHPLFQRAITFLPLISVCRVCVCVPSFNVDLKKMRAGILLCFMLL